MEEENVLIYRFSGRAVNHDFDEKQEERIDINESSSRDRGVVKELNLISDSICSDIENYIARKSPPEWKITVQINFKEGSVAWDGVVMVLNTMATFSGAAATLVYLKNLVEISVNTLVYQRISHMPGHRYRITASTVVTPVSNNTANKQNSYKSGIYVMPIYVLAASIFVGGLSFFASSFLPEKAASQSMIKSTGGGNITVPDSCSIICSGRK